MPETISLNEAVSNIQRHIATEKKVVATAQRNLDIFEKRGSPFAVQTWKKIIVSAQNRIDRLKENINILTEHNPKVISLLDAA